MLISPDELRDYSLLYERGQYLSLYAQLDGRGPLDAWQGPDAAVLAGKLAVNLGAPRYGQTIHRRAWRKYPQHAELWYYVGWVELRRRGPLAALQHLDRFALPNHSDDELRADWLAQRAHCLAMLRDFESAEADMEEALALTPQRPWLHVENASLHEMEDQAEASLESALYALELQPYYRPAIQQACHAMVQLNRDEDALNLLDRARNHLQSGALLSQYACLLVELRRYDEARECFEQLGAFFPLIQRDKEMQQWLAARRSDSAYFCGDFETATELAKQVDRPFFKSVAERMQNADGNCRRVELDVGFVRQNYATCAPATLAAICGYWNRHFDHLEVAESICYDGTPDHNERNWVEEHGFVAREFRVTPEASQALLDIGIPFTLTTVGPGVAHLQAVFGYDSRRGVLLVRDPNERHFNECLADEMIQNQTSTGPRGMAFVPEEEAEKLQTIDLPDADSYDDYYELQRALHDYDRQRAERAYHRMETRAADHRLTIHGRARLAHYDSDELTLARCSDRLLAKFPDDVNQQMARLRMLRENGTREQRLTLLRDICAKDEYDPSFRRLYAEELLDDGRESEHAAYLLRRSMRSRPLDAENFRLLANLCWSRRDREQALELLRFAACLEDKNETRAMAYFSASRYLNRTEEAVRFLKDRFRRLGALKSWPAETLCAAYEQLEQHEKAFKVLEEALERLPNDGELMLTAAKHYSRLRREETADELLGRAKDRCPPSAWLQAMAHRAWYGNDLDEALRYGREVLAADPFNREMNDLVAAVLHNLQGPEAAAEHFRDLVNRYPNHYLLRAQLIEALPDDDLTAKEDEVRRFLELHPQDPWARRELAIVLSRQQRFDEAMTEANTAVELEEANPVGHFVCAVIHEGRDELEQARRCCRRSVELSVDYEPAIYRLIELCQTKAQRQAELDFLYEQLVGQVTFGEGLLTLREVAGRTIGPERLLEILREALDVRPDLWQAWSAVTHQLIDMDRGEEAVATSRSAIERFPMLPRMLLDLAAAYESCGDGEGEMEAVDKALTLNPSWGEALRNKSDVLRRLGRLDAAATTLETAIGHEPRNVTHLGELADVLWMQGNRERAVSVMKEAVQREPRYDWGWRKLREWSGTMRRPELVIDLGREIVAQRPSSAGCWLLFADILGDSPSHFDESLQTVGKAIELNPRNADAYALLASLLARAGRFDDAVQACRPEVLATQRPRLLRVKEADIECQRGNMAEAIEQVKGLVAEDPEFALGWSRLADWYDFLAENENYLDAAQNLMRIAPRHAAAWGYAGDGLLRLDRRDEAKQHLQKALDLDPAYTFAGVRLFELQIEDGQFDAALQTLDACGPNLPDDFRLACQVQALAGAGRTDEAFEHFDRLARCNMDDGESIVKAADALWGADQGPRLGDRLERLIHADDASPQVGVAWVRQAVRCDDDDAVRRKLKTLPDGSERWAIVCREFATFQGKLNKPRGLAWLVRRYRGPLRNDTSCWAAVGSAYRDLSLDRKVVAWMADWRSRDDIEAGMLFPLVLARLAVKDDRTAAEVANHAVGLTIDASFDYHLIWLAALSLLDQAPQRAIECFSRINPSGYNEYYQQLYGMIQTILEVLSADPTQMTWPAARAHLDAGRKGVQEENWRDPAIRRIYWRCRETAARRCGATLAVWFARIMASISP